MGFIPSPVNLETILIRREVQARKAAKALAKYVCHAAVCSSSTHTYCSGLLHPVILIIIFIVPTSTAHSEISQTTTVKIFLYLSQQELFFR